MRDRSLWKSIDLSPFSKELNLEKLGDIIDCYGGSSTRNLTLCGQFDIFEKDQPKPNQLVYLNVVFLSNILTTKCYNLQSISLANLDLSQISFSLLLPLKNLRELSLKCCSISSTWFDSDTSLVQKLYLIRTGQLDANEVADICRAMPGLRVLSISQCASTIGDEDLELIVHNLVCLEELDLTNTRISDASVYGISRSINCQRLIRLNLSMSGNLSNLCLTSISNGLFNLRTLFLTSCFGISNIQLLNLSHLEYLNINNTSVEKNEKLSEFALRFPKCEVEFGHANMLRNKSMWTISTYRFN